MAIPLDRSGEPNIRHHDETRHIFNSSEKG